MKVERLRRPVDDRIVDMIRGMALREACHVVLVSLGDEHPHTERARSFNALLPECLRERTGCASDVVERFLDADEAEHAFEAACDAVATFASNMPSGVSAILARRDGIVLMALPRSVQTVRSTPFPGFMEEAS